ncbi:uncharacterized protein LOC129580466 [Sitodiplosis mosellana]|uniref:uncharacterized protein LOC129580466 n=1 Tax=Sitodiplosis mosellana TaxID=263140 RepID=UPI002444EAFE|nr:uncharacterized protein LOC129580466 [Sitodiplosis mosellana]XP_055326886.1 uncharacterized protein LOC129580466 [Sitodiplosis mosellana]
MSTNCNNLIKTPLVTVANIATMASSAQHNHTPQKQPQHPITTTKMGSRRIFSAQFKLTVLDSYRMDADCKGNQRATARKYGIHRRQIQKWLQNETNLRSSVNNNNNSDLQNNQNNNNTSSHSNANKMSAMQTAAVAAMNGGGAVLNGRTTVNNLSLSGVDNVSAKRLIHENASATNKSILNQSTMSGSPTTNFHFNSHHQQQQQQQQHHHQQKHNANEINAMSLDIPRHSVAANARIHNNSNSNSGNAEHTMTKTKTTGNYSECYGEYKCATNAAAPTTNTSFPVSSTSTSPALAPSFVARPMPHSSNESTVSYASQRQPLRIVSPSYLLPSPQANASHAPNGIPMIDAAKAAFHPTHYPATYHHPRSAAAVAAAFHEINPMLYDSVPPPPPIGMIPSIRHYLGTPHHDALQVATFASRVMPSAFENPFHLPHQNGFYDHHNAYELYPSYLPPIAVPTAMMPERIVPKTEIITEIETIPNVVDELPERPQSPIDLTVPGRQTLIESSRSYKPRFSLPSPPVKAAYKALEIPHSDGSSTAEHKPWDLRCTRKRKVDDDIDEGISVNGEQSKLHEKSASSPTPAKVVKLFKPYLMSSDDEDDDENDGKKCSKSDEQTQQRDPIIWSNSLYGNSSPTTITPFQSPIVNTQPQTHSSYWSNHGSPVSGYDSASSTFSDCNCSDSNCQTKLASPAPTVASFSDDFTASPISSSSTETTNTETTVSTTPPTKYIIPRRQILEKWSHEDDEASQQFDRSQRDLIVR